MSTSPTLWGDTFAPVTEAIGFLRAPLGVVADELLVWRKRVHGSASAQEISGDLRSNIYRLEPLTAGIRPRELVVATADPEWSAVFDCGLLGGDPVSTVGYLSRTLQVQGVVTVSVQDARGGAHRPERYGARQFEMFAPIATDFINYVRSVSVVRDGTKWRFDANGTVQDFEDTEAYARRRVSERFTAEMLVDYAAAVGLRPFAEDFYPGPCVLVSNSAASPDVGMELTIREAQLRFGIAPVA